MRSRTGTALRAILAVLGVLLIAGAAVLYWVVLPSQAKLPADTDTTRRFDGTAKILLDPQAIASGDLSMAVVRNTPVTATRVVKVLATDGNAAEVSDSRTLTAANGQTVGRSDVTYAVDRKTLQAATRHPSAWQVVDHEGLTVSWPIGAEKKDYTGWVNETKSTTPVRYLRREKKAGVDTYVYSADAAPQPIKDEQVLETLPKTLPATALAALSQVLPIPADLQAQMAAVLPRLTAPVPLNYTYQVKSTYWVEPTTGVVVDLQREEIRNAGLALPGATASPPGITVYDVVASVTDQSVRDAANDAKADRDKINLYGRILPLIFLIVGIALIIGLVLIATARRGRRAGVRQPTAVT